MKSWAATGKRTCNAGSGDGQSPLLALSVVLLSPEVSLLSLTTEAAEAHHAPQVVVQARGSSSAASCLRRHWMRSQPQGSGEGQGARQVFRQVSDRRNRVLHDQGWPGGLGEH